MAKGTMRPPVPDRARTRTQDGTGRSRGATAGAQLSAHTSDELLRLYKQVLSAVHELNQALRISPIRPRASSATGLESVPAMRSPVRFWHAWRAGEISGLPYTTCSFAQAYVAYRRFSESLGELPCTRNAFTHALLLASEAAGSPVRGKIMRIGAWPALASERMLLVTDPPERDQGAWATACSREFGEALSSYVSGSPRSPVRTSKRQRRGA